MLAGIDTPAINAVTSTATYSVSSTRLCSGNDVPPFQLDNIDTFVGETITSGLGPFCSLSEKDLNVSVVEHGRSYLPDGLSFDKQTLVLNGSLSFVGTHTLEVTVASSAGENKASFTITAEAY